MYRLIFVDMDIVISDAPAEASSRPANELRLVRTGTQLIDGVLRYYYAAEPPLRILIVMRNGMALEDVPTGYYLKALVGWDDGTAFVLPGDAGKQHTKLSVDLVLDDALIVRADVGLISLSSIVARAPRSDRPGGWRGGTPGRPPVAAGDRVEQHNITLPSQLWRRVEHAGVGNRSAGIRKLIEGEDNMAVSLPGSVAQMLRMWPEATAVAMEVDGQCAIVVKMERRDAQSAHRPGVPVAFQSQLGLYPDAGAVIRLALEIRDQPGNPLKFETFLDPGSPHDDPALLRKLQNQTMLAIHIFDMRINYQYSKVIPFRDVARNDLAALCEQAAEFLATLPADRRNFGRARDQMMAELPL